LKEYFIYWKARRNGFIQHKKMNGRSVWAISPDAPKEVKEIGQSIPRMQVVLYSIVEAVKIMVCFLALLTLLQTYYKGI
jgi:hypothetical protein